MRRIFSKFLCMIALVGTLAVLAACGFGAEPTPTPEPVTMRYVTFTGLDAAEQSLIRQFEADNPQVTIASEEYNQSPDEYLANVPAPDLMLITPGQFLDAAIERGGLTDLTDLWQQAGVDDDFVASLRALSEREGKQYYLPVGYNWNGIYYNKQVFEQYGLQPARTWDEFIQLCESLWLEGITPLAVSGNDPFMGTLWLDYLGLRLNGPEFQREFLAGMVPYDDPQVRSVFELWASLVEKGYFLQNSSTMGTLEALTSVAQKGNITGAKAAMALSGPAFMGDLPPELRDELGFFPFPTLDSSQPPAEVVMSIGYMVPTQAPQREQALAFVSHLASEQGRELLTKDVMATGLYAPAFVTEVDETIPEIVRQGMELVQQAESVTVPYFMSVEPRMWPALNEMLRRMLTEPGSSKGFDLDALLSKLEAAR